MTDPNHLAAAAADECRRIIEEKDRLLEQARDERDAARDQASRIFAVLTAKEKALANLASAWEHGLDGASRDIGYEDAKGRPVLVGHLERVIQQHADALRGILDGTALPAPVPPGETTPAAPARPAGCVCPVERVRREVRACPVHGGDHE